MKFYPQTWNAESQKGVYLDKKLAKKLLPTVDYDLLPTNRKYEGVYKPLPIISNQNLNYGIKDLCQLAGVDEPVEIVPGRRTFVTLSLEKGMSAEEVMSITGHQDYKSFKRYLKVTEQRKKVVMVKAWGGALSENKLKVV